MNCTASRRVLVRIGPAAHSSNLCIMDLHWLPSLPSNHPLPQPCFPRPLPKSTTCTHTLVSRFASGGTQPKTVGKMGQGKLARIIIPGERVQAGRRQEIRGCFLFTCNLSLIPTFPQRTAGCEALCIGVSLCDICTTNSSHVSIVGRLHRGATDPLPGLLFYVCFVEAKLPPLPVTWSWPRVRGLGCWTHLNVL